MKSIALIVVALVLSQVGCSMCSGPFDYDYPSFGGKHPRANRSHGRVGSILSDPITTLTGPSADSNLTPPPELLETSSSDDEDDLLDDDTLDDDLLDDGLDDRSDDDLLDDDLLDDDLLDDELERIDPLRNEEALDSPAKGDADVETGVDAKVDADDTTASSRWRPRSLR